MRLIFWMLSIVAAGLPISSYAAEDVKSTSATVNFQVEVLAKQCTVEVGPNQSADGKVYLGTFPGKVGVAGPMVPIAFRFTDCKSVSAIQSIEFTRDLGALNGGNPGSQPGGPTEGFISTNKSKVRIFLWDDADGATPFRSRNFTPAHTIDPAAWVPACYAQAKVMDINGDGVGAQAGSFEGKAEFTVTYQ